MSLYFEVLLLLHVKMNTVDLWICGLMDNSKYNPGLRNNAVEYLSTCFVSFPLLLLRFFFSFFQELILCTLNLWGITCHLFLIIYFQTVFHTLCLICL